MMVRRRTIRRIRETFTAVSILAVTSMVCPADIMLNLKTTYFTAAHEDAVSGTGPAYWLVWSADTVLGQIYDGGTMVDGDIVFFQGTFSTNPLAGFYGLGENPLSGHVFTNGTAGVSDFNAGYLIGVGFNCRPGEIVTGTVYRATSAADLTAFADFTRPLPLTSPPPTSDHFDFAQAITFDIFEGPHVVEPAPSPVPDLGIALGPTGRTATVFWTPPEPGWILQETLTLTPPTWTNSGTGDTNPVTVPASATSKFFRLFSP
jgi:hypothetical protein